MTEKEIAEFRDSTGCNVIPRTVEEYDRVRLLTAVRLRELATQAQSPEEYLLNTILADIEEGHLIDAVAAEEPAWKARARWRRWKRAPS